VLPLPLCPSLHLVCCRCLSAPLSTWCVAAASLPLSPLGVLPLPLCPSLAPARVWLCARACASERVCMIFLHCICTQCVCVYERVSESVSVWVCMRECVSQSVCVCVCCDFPAVYKKKQMERLAREFEGAGTAFENVSRRVLVRTHTLVLLHTHAHIHGVGDSLEVRLSLEVGLRFLVAVGFLVATQLVARASLCKEPVPHPSTVGSPCLVVQGARASPLHSW